MDVLAADLLLSRFLKRSSVRSRLFPKGEIKVVVPITGVRTIVRLIEVDGVGRAVARIFPPSEKGQLRQLTLAGELVERHNLNAPKTLEIFRGDRSGAVLLLEEFIQGPHPDPAALDPEQIKQLADLFSRLHDNDAASDSFGPLTAPRRGAFSREARRQARNRFRSVGRWSPAAVSSSARRAAKAWFRQFSRRLDSLGAYSLIHDKPNRGNLIWSEEKKQFFLIDLATMRRGHRAKDMVQVCHEPLGDDPEKTALFLDRYFQNGRNGDPGEFRGHEPFHHAYYHLSQCAINCRRLHKYGALQDSEADYAQVARDQWALLEEVIQNNPA